MTTLATFDVFLRADTSQFNRSMDSAKKSGQGFVSNMASIAGGFLVANVAMAAFQKGVDVLGSTLIGYNARMEQARIGFTTLLGSAEQADAFIKELQHFANVTPFDFPGLQQASTTMMAMGFNAQEVIPALTAVGDVVAALGKSGGEASESINRIVYNLGQMKQYGRVTGRDIRDLTMLGVPVVKILAEGFHKSTGEMQQMITKGVIPADKALKILFKGIESGNMGGMMEAQAKTFNGAMSTINDTINQLVGGALKPLFDAISQAVVGFSQWIQTKQVQAFFNEIRTAVRAFVIVLQNLMPTVIKVVSGIVTTIGTIARAWLTEIGHIIGLVQQLAHDLFTGGQNAVQAFAEGMYSGFQAYVTAVVQAIADFISGFLIGQSPPKMGPLSKIYEGGRNVIEAWVQGAMSADLSPILKIPDKIKVGLKKLEAAGKSVQNVIDGIDTRISYLDLDISKLQLSIDKITYAYEQQLRPLQKAYDLLMKTYTLQDKRRDLELALQRNSLEQQMNAAKGDWWAQAQIQAQLDALDQQQQANALVEEQQNLQAQIAALPLEEQMQSVTDQMDAQLEPLQEQMKLLQMQRSQLDYQRSVWQMIATDVERAARAMREAASSSKAAGGAKKPSLAGGPAAKSMKPNFPIDPQIKIDEAAIEKKAQELAKSFMDGVGNFIKDNWPTAVGAILGALVFGPIGAIAGAAIGTLFSGPIKTALNNGIETLQKVLSGDGGITKNFTLENILKVVSDGLSAALDWIENTGIPMAATAVGTLATSFVSWIGETTPKIIEALPAITQAIIDFIVTNTPILLGKLLDWGMALSGWVITEALPALLENLPKVALAIGGFLLKLFFQLQDGAIRLAKGFAGTLLDWLGRLPGQIWDIFVKVIGKITAFAGDITSKALALGADFAANLIKGIAGLAKSVSDIIGQVTKVIGDLIKDGPGKWLTLAQTWGRGFANGISNLMENAINTVIKGLNSFKIDFDGLDLGPMGHVAAIHWNGLQLPTVSLPNFAKGAWPGLPFDTVAQLHRGEGVMPRNVMDRLMNLLDTGGGAGLGLGVVVNGPLVQIEHFSGSQAEVDDLMDKMAHSLRLQKARA